MRQLITAILIMFMCGSAGADTTNRALQVSPVPGLFVGGVGLLCVADVSADVSADDSADDPAGDLRQYFLLTKDRETFGWARFEKDDDIHYLRFAVSKSPDHYRMANEAVTIAVNRKSLVLTMDDAQSQADYTCEAMSITNLHNAAKVELGKLLKGNRI